ncbi:MAG: hypothetical protein KDD69_16230 [Bdellovibrionales bacterium]|nr:hypothetical protein [Bdellovibrionales bacterium]
MQHDERGAVLTEATVVILLFFVLIIAAVELLRCGYYSLTTQFVASAALREASVGPHVFSTAASPASLGGSQDAAEEIPPYESFLTEQIIQKSREFGVSLSGQHIQVRCVGLGECGDTAGRPGALVEVRVRFPVQALFVGDFELQSSAMMRNELWVF